MGGGGWGRGQGHWLGQSSRQGCAAGAPAKQLPGGPSGQERKDVDAAQLVTSAFSHPSDTHLWHVWLPPATALGAVADQLLPLPCCGVCCVVCRRTRSVPSSFRLRATTSRCWLCMRRGRPTSSAARGATKTSSRLGPGGSTRSKGVLVCSHTALRVPCGGRDCPEEAVFVFRGAAAHSAYCVLLAAMPSPGCQARVLLLLGNKDDLQEYDSQRTRAVVLCCAVLSSHRRVR